MSGEVEIARWQEGTPLPVQLSIPSGTDIVAIAFGGGTIVATEKLSIVPEEVKTLQLVPLAKQTLSVAVLREDRASAFPNASVTVDVYDMRAKQWVAVAEGNTSARGEFQADLAPVRGLYGGQLLAGYVSKYETSYRITAEGPDSTNATTIVVPSTLVDVYPGIPVDKTCVPPSLVCSHPPSPPPLSSLSLETRKTREKRSSDGINERRES